MITAPLIAVLKEALAESKGGQAKVASSILAGGAEEEKQGGARFDAVE